MTLVRGMEIGAILLLLLSDEGTTEQVISVGEEDNGQVTITGPPGSVQPGSQIKVTNNSTGDFTIINSNEDGSFVIQIAARQGDLLTVAYADTGATQPGGIPPGPAARNEEPTSTGFDFPVPPASPVITILKVGGWGPPTPPPF